MTADARRSVQRGVLARLRLDLQTEGDTTPWPKQAAPLADPARLTEDTLQAAPGAWPCQTAAMRWSLRWATDRRPGCMA